MIFNLDVSQLVQGGITATFNDIGISTEYRYQNSYNKENDRGNNGSKIEIVKGVERNTEIMQCGIRNDCEKNKFPKRFPFGFHGIPSHQPRTGVSLRMEGWKESIFIIS